VGAEGLDWRQDYPQMDILLDLDQVEFTALWPDGEQSKYSADGTITSQLSFFGGGDFATALEADISHTLRSGARVESHVRMDQGKDGHAPLRHGPNSWAAVDGLGSFEIFGTVDAGGGLADLVLTGIDTLTFSRFEGAKGWESCMKVDGEVVDGNCAD
jgi:hypothetical protein